MRAVVQRVLNAGVTVDGECVGKIGRGYLVLLGVGLSLIRISEPTRPY